MIYLTYKTHFVSAIIIIPLVQGLRGPDVSTVFLSSIIVGITVRPKAKCELFARGRPVEGSFVVVTRTEFIIAAQPQVMRFSYDCFQHTNNGIIFCLCINDNKLGISAGTLMPGLIPIVLQTIFII